MVDWKSLQARQEPFRHWVGSNFISDALVREINATWPVDADWTHEAGSFSKKSALMFPRRLNDAAQQLASHLFAEPAVDLLSSMVGYQLLADPWFETGPKVPRVGGGLHEIFPGGLLKMHVDFNRHPAGVTRALNLLVYLNEDWRPEWGGELELHGKTVARIVPNGGAVAIFETTPQSWHGHPHPLACPQGKSRRSLALYYYTRSAPADRETTVYRR